MSPTSALGVSVRQTRQGASTPGPLGCQTRVVSGIVATLVHVRSGTSETRGALSRTERTRNSHEVSLVLVHHPTEQQINTATANMTKSNTPNSAKSHANQRPVVMKGGVTKSQKPRLVEFNVAGVTFEDRQALLERCKSAGITTCTIQAEPVPDIDMHAKSVRVQLQGESLHVGFVPRRLTGVVREGSAHVVDTDTFDDDGSPVYYCKVRAERA